jgi:hypothetical protein
MKFPYLALPSRRPIPSLGGSRVRYRLIIAVHLIGPTGARLLSGNLDAGSDDTLFPLPLATHLGLDLTSAAEGEARSVGGPAIRYVYASATLRVADGSEACEWTAIVGFIDVPLRWAILGHAGFLQFFDVQLLGARREALLAPNASFTGWHALHQPSRP